MAAALPMISSESGLSRYLNEIRKFPMLQPEQEYMLAKRWKSHEDPDAAHQLVTSHLRLVAKIAMGYRGYGLPIGEVISEGNVGLMQAVKRFEPDKGFRLATYAIWWIRASIQEYILRSWSLVKMGTTANQKKLFFNLRKAKSQISALEEGESAPRARRRPSRRKLGVTEAGRDRDESPPLRRHVAQCADARRRREGEWQDWLVDDSTEPGGHPGRSRRRSDNRHDALVAARLKRAERPRTPHLRGASVWPRTRSRSRSCRRSSTSRASASARSRSAPSKRCRPR